MNLVQEECFLSLSKVILSYSYVSSESLVKLQNMCKIKNIKKGDTLLHFGDFSKDIYFICKGLLRTYILDENGNVYNKNIFLENEFSGSKVSLILGTPSDFSIEALENTTLISIPYIQYKELIVKNNDLKDFYIAYLEKNWIIEKEKYEISLVLEDATKRYQTYLKKHPNIEKRVNQHHIAAHLGITPTQLSRIRKKLK